jgi:hypothetical protein
MVKIIAMTYAVPLLQILNLYPDNKYNKYPVLGDSHTYTVRIAKKSSEGFTQYKKFWPFYFSIQHIQGISNFRLDFEIKL